MTLTSVLALALLLGLIGLAGFGPAARWAWRARHLNRRRRGAKRAR